MRQFAFYLLPFVLWATSASAQSFDAAANTDRGGNDPSTWAFTIANQANRLIIANTHIRANNVLPPDTPSSLSTHPTWNSVSVGTEAISDFQNSDTYGLRREINYLVGPDIGTNNVSFDYDSVPDHAIESVVSIYGVNQTTPIGNPCTNYRNDTTGSTSASVTCSTTDGQLLVCFIAVASNSGSSGTINAVTGTLRGSQVTIAARLDAAIATVPATGSSTACSFSWTNSRDWVITGIPVNPLELNASKGFFLLGQ